MDTGLRQSILDANRELHREEAALYDRIHPELTNGEEAARLRRMLDAAEKGLPSGGAKTALDIGAGTGFVTAELVRRGFKVTAVDISPEMLEVLEKKFASEVQAGKAATVAQDVDSFLATRQDAYSIITVSSVLHHLPDYAATLKVLADRLIPGGALVIFHEPTGGDLTGFEMALRKLDWQIAWKFLTTAADRETIKAKKLDYGMADYHVTHGFDESKVQVALAAVGLEVEIMERYATAKTRMVRSALALSGKRRTWCLLARRKAWG